MQVMRKRPGGAISLVHLHVLSVLEHDGPQAMRGLAEALDVSRASATGIVDRMAERGLVTRQRGTADRRVIRVSLTAEGGALLSGLSAERREAVGELLDELTDAELEGFLLGARAMRRARERRHAQRGADCRSVGQPSILIALLRRYLPRYRWPLLLVIVLLFVQAVGTLYLPELNAEIINEGVVTGDTDVILRTGAVMLVVSLVLMAAAIVGVYYSARVAMGFGRDVRSAIFRSVESFSQADVNHFGTLLIADGGPFPYSKDGATFQNREGILPSEPQGFYEEYTVERRRGPTTAAPAASSPATTARASTPTTTTTRSANRRAIGRRSTTSSPPRPPAGPRAGPRWSSCCGDRTTP